MNQEYDIYDLGFDSFLNKEFSFFANNNLNTSQSLSNIITGTSSENLLSGEFIGNFTMQDGFLQSGNFAENISGWRLTPDSAQLPNLTIVGGTLKYGKTSFSDSTNAGYYLGNEGLYVGSTTDATKLKYTLVDGSLEFVGAVTTTTGSSIGTSYLSGIVGLSNTNIAAQGWTNTCIFSATDYHVVAWTAGIITTAAGTAYNITAGNTGNMSALTYIYFDKTVSETVLQTTTTASTAVGSNKILIAVAKNNSETSKDAIFQVYGGSGGINPFITADNIAANTITASEIAANTITSSEVTTGELITLSAQIKDAIITNAKIANGTIENAKIKDATIDKAKIASIDAGTITAGTLTGRTIQTATSGQRVIIDSSNDYIKFYDSNGNLSGTIAGAPTYGIYADGDFYINGNLQGVGNLYASRYYANAGSGSGIEPTWNNSVTCGSSSKKWSNVYSTLGNFSGAVSVGSISSGGNISPTSDGSYSLGSSSYRWLDLYLAGYIDNAIVTESLRAPKNSSAPTGYDARIYYDTTSKKLRVYIDGTWKDISTN